MSSKKKAGLLLSTDSLSWYWLDLIFQTASNVGFDWIDLAMWKNFDSWSYSYVKKLSENHNIPVKCIQLSENVNSREMNQAVDIAKYLSINTISINAPKITNFKSYKFIVNNIWAYKRHNPDIKFCMINPPKSNLFILPVYTYNFTSIVEIFKKYKMFLWLDIVNLDETILETNFLRKMANFIPYIWIVYVSDKTKTWVWHAPLWQWTLKLESIFKKFKQNEYYGDFSLKLNLDKLVLSDIEKVEQVLKKSRLFYKDNYIDLVID